MPTLDQLSEPLRDARRQFEAILEPHRPALWAYCRQLTGSAWDAEDLVQDTLLRAFAGLPQIWQPLDARAYLFRVATNCWIDQVRRDRRATLEDIDEHPELVAAEDTARPLEVSEAIERLVRRLPPRQRVILLLCEVLDFRAREVAGMLGITEGAVKSVLHRARASLAEPGEPAADTAAAMHQETAAVIQRYVDAFNARDADAIAMLLDLEATTVIVGSAQELGREVSRHASIAEWAADPNPQWAVAGQLDGEPALFVFYRSPSAERALACLIRLETRDQSVHRQRVYYYCPELIRYAAAALGVPATTHGYQYEVGVA